MPSLQRHPSRDVRAHPEVIDARRRDLNRCRLGDGSGRRAIVTDRAGRLAAALE